MLCQVSHMLIVLCIAVVDGPQGYHVTCLALQHLCMHCCKHDIQYCCGFEHACIDIIALSTKKSKTVNGFTLHAYFAAD